MHLHLVRVRNFRGLKDISVSLTAGLNVLVGENNVGKTALLDAVRAALGPGASTGAVLKIGCRTPTKRRGRIASRNFLTGCLRSDRTKVVGLLGQ